MPVAGCQDHSKPFFKFRPFLVRTFYARTFFPGAHQRYGHEKRAPFLKPGRVEDLGHVPQI